MHTARHELSRYGLRRLRKIASFLKYGGRGAWEVLLSNVYDIDSSGEVSAEKLVNYIANCGVFEAMANRFEQSWERLLSEIVISQNFVYGLCSLFGIDTVMLDRSSAFVYIQKIVNKLSTVYTFPGDPSMARCRKRMNDIRLNSLFHNNIFGQEPLVIAQQITSFEDAIKDPILRFIFWSCYRPGTGQFKISVSNLDKVVNEDDSCSICLDSFDVLCPGVRIKPCSHIFHTKCIQDLILSMDKRVLCPLCRAEIKDFY